MREELKDNFSSPVNYFVSCLCRKIYNTNIVSESFFLQLPQQPEVHEATGQLVQTGVPVQLSASEVLLEYRLLFRFPLPVCGGADGRLPGDALHAGGAALHLAVHAGV